MLGYLLRRLAMSVPILLGVCLATFVLFYFTSGPEQMARANLPARNPTEEQIQDWLKERGYDRPLTEQFRAHSAGLFLLRFGRSDATGEPIWDRIRAGVGPSAAVASLVFAGSLLAAVWAALLLASYRDTYVDAFGLAACVLGMSVSYLVVIIAGQYVLGKTLRWFPVAGYLEGFDAARFVAVPALLGILSGLGGSIRFYRTVILEEMNQDYVRTARAKGVSERNILFKHVLKNAAVPIVTTAVMHIPFLLMGSLLLESFFGIPGLGTYTVDAINSQDFAVVRAMVFLGTLLTIAGQMMTDVAYAIVDPRVRLE